MHKKLTVFLIIAFAGIISGGQVFAQPFGEFSTNLGGSSNGTVNWVDVNNDNRLDIFICGSSGSKPSLSTLYINQAGNSFVPSNIYFPSVRDGAAAWGDYDNDGDLDLLLTGYKTEGNPEPITRLYRNNLPYGFEESEMNFTGLYAGSANWADFDNDGDLDLIITGFNAYRVPKTMLYINKGQDNFVSINTSITPVFESSITTCDIDGDTDIDIIITGKDKPFSISSSKDALTKVFTNKKLVFTESSVSLPAVIDGSIAWGDYDNDGHGDILITGIFPGQENADVPISISQIFRNQRNGKFENINATLKGVHQGIGLWGDCDNDGDLDILLSGLEHTPSGAAVPLTTVYINNSGSFTELPSITMEKLSRTSGAWGDFDNDHDLDILIAGSDVNGNAITKVYDNESDMINNVPIEPKGLTTTVDNGADDNFVTFIWLPGQDAETSTKALTYNLRIGTTPGGSEIMSPNSTPSEFPLLPGRGNVDNNTSWSVINLAQGSYYWSVQTVDNSFSISRYAPEQTFKVGSSTNINQIGSEIPESFNLGQNYPNPFNPSTKIRYSLPGGSDVSIAVYNSIGQEVTKLVDQFHNAGTYEVTWNGNNSNGSRVASGIYFYTIRTETNIDTRKMLFVK